MLFAVMMSAFTLFQTPQSKINASSKDYDYTLSLSDEWSIIEVPCYDEYGRRYGYATAQVAMRRTSNGYEYKARKNGFRYNNDEWFPVRRGNYRCGDMTCHFKVEQWGEFTFYFNL